MRKDIARLALLALAVLLAGGVALAEGKADYFQPAKQPPTDTQMYKRSDLQPDPGPVEPLPVPISSRMIIEPFNSSDAVEHGSAVPDSGTRGGFTAMGGAAIPGGSSGGAADLDPTREAERRLQRLIRRLEG